MRTLFKGKSKESKEWFYGGLYVQSHNTAYIISKRSKIFSGLIEVDIKTIGEYVGRRDVNLERIFSNVDRFKFKYMVELDDTVELVGVFVWSEDELRYEIDVEENNSNITCLSYIGNGIMHGFELIKN